MIETQIFKTLLKYDFSQTAISILDKRLHQWCNDKTNHEIKSTIPMELAKIENRKTKLTDALIDELIDKPTYQNRIQQLLIQETELLEKQKISANPEQIKQNIRKFLELLKSPILSHSLANSEEKAQMVKSLFSNREISDKNVDLKPYKWLVRTDNLLSTLYGTQCRGASLSGNDLGSSEIEQVLEITNCLEFQRLLQLVENANLKNQPLKLPKYETA